MPVMPTVDQVALNCTLRPPNETPHKKGKSRPKKGNNGQASRNDLPHILIQAWPLSGETDQSWVVAGIGPRSAHDEGVDS